MKMLIVVYSKFLVGDVQTIMNRLRVKGYTEIPKAFGTGPISGRVDDTRYGPGYNHCLFAAVEDDRVPELLRAFQELVEGHRKQWGRPAALHAFVQDCVQAM